MGIQAKALLAQLNAVCKAVDEFAQAVERTLGTHPDAPIMLSFPGVGAQVGARSLAEIGDSRARLTTPGGLKAYAGSAPITRASGQHRYVGRRFVQNNRLDHTVHLCAFATLTRSDPRPLRRRHRFPTSRQA
jgi:transposase